MSGLRNETVALCCQALVECEEFSTQERLRTVFNCVELSPYAGKLPEAASVQERADQTIKYLVRQRRDVTGQWVIMSFLEILRQNYRPPHGYYNTLTQLIKAIEHELHTGLDEIEIPFVTLAMTSDEANELLHNPDFQPSNGISKHEFDQLLSSLKMSSNNILDHYTQTRDHWKPYVCQEADTRLESLVKELLKDINLTRSSNNLPDVFANFYTHGFFEKENQICDMLYEYGCIVVADALSLLHPSVWDIYDQSAIRNRKEKASLMVLVPDISPKTSIPLFFEKFMKDKMGWHFYEFEKKLLRTYELNIGDLTTFRRRLFTMIPETIHVLQNKEPDPESLASLIKFKKTNIAGLIFKG